MSRNINGFCALILYIIVFLKSFILIFFYLNSLDYVYKIVYL